MNVLSRKMFQKARPRPARDALNKAGGIMSSSPELMNTVQMYENGGDISLFPFSGLKIPKSIATDIYEKGKSFLQGALPSYQNTVAGREESKEQAKKTSIENPDSQVKSDFAVPTGAVVGGVEVEGFPIFVNGRMVGYEGANAPGFFAADSSTNVKPQPPSPMEFIGRGDKLNKLSEAGVGDISPMDVVADQAFLDKQKQGIAQYVQTRGPVQELINKQRVAGQQGISSLDRMAEGYLQDDRYDFSPNTAERAEILKENREASLNQPNPQGVINPDELDFVVSQTDAQRNREASLARQQTSAVEEMQAELEAQRIVADLSNQEKAEQKVTDASLDGMPDQDVVEAQRAEAKQDASDIETIFDQPEPVKTDTTLKVEEANKIASDARDKSTKPDGESVMEAGTNLAVSVENNDQVALQSGLKDIMAQFISNAPKYEGIDKGLALMKIGAAMSSGTSPYALVNISKALSSGADMFIKDKASKDAFNRQVGLAALKYGMSKQATEEAQLRSDMRNFDLYVVGEGGFTDPRPGKNNRFIPKGGHVELSMADRMKYGDKMESLASVKSLKDYAAIYAPKIDPAKAAGITGQQKEARTFINQAEDATRAIGIFDNVKKLINDPETAPFARGIKGFLAETADKAGVFFGIEMDKKYSTRKQIETKALAALGDIVGVAIGNTQSANSISDRDVLNQIIKPFFGGLVQEDANGEFFVNLNNKEIVNSQIDTAISLLLAKQTQAIQGFDDIAGNLARVPRVAGYKGTGSDFLLDSQERRSVFDVGPGGFTQSNMPVFDLGYDDEGIVTSMTLSKKKKT